MPKKGSSKHGKQTKAGLLLSKFLRSISEEETELTKNADGEDKMVSKAEAMARLMYNMALGYTETTTTDEGKEFKTYHSPDRALMALILDRVDGKAQSQADSTTKQSIPDKVTEQGVNRINKAGGVVDAGNQQ